MSSNTSTLPSQSRIRACFIDLSGTLHIGDAPIDGAIQAIQRLQQANIPIVFLTNTTKVSSKQLYQQLYNMGFTTIQPNEIMTSLTACRTFLQHSQLLRPFFLLESLDDFEGYNIPLDPPHNCVVVGLAPSKLDYAHLNQAFHILESSTEQTNKNKLIAIHQSMYYRDSNDTLSLGPGGFVECLSQASNTTPILIGKPNATFYQAALQQVGCGVGENVVMVGDDVFGDVLGAQNAGIGTTILVQTGKYREGDENKAPSSTIVVPSIVQAVDYILKRATIGEGAQTDE